MQKFAPHAIVCSNDRFYKISSQAVELMIIGDPEGVRLFLPPDEKDEVLGRAVRQALAASRAVPREYVSQLINSGELKRMGEEECSLMMRKFGYTGKRALYKSMKFCPVSVMSEGIEFQPTHRKGLNGFTVRTNLDLVPVIVPQTASDMELGLALREAFTRCT